MTFFKLKLLICYHDGSNWTGLILWSEISIKRNNQESYSPTGFSNLRLVVTVSSVSFYLLMSQ